MNSPLLTLIGALVVLTLLYILLRPGKGLLYTWRRSRGCTMRVRCEDALKHLFRYELQERPASLENIAGAIGIGLDEAAALVEELERNGFISEDADTIRLTAEGRKTAQHIMRAHRLLETYMADRTGYDQLEWHGRAEELEHSLSREEADALASQLGYPLYDPHGDPIPGFDGEIVPHDAMLLHAADPGQHYRIVHIEDEPDAVYARIVAADLHPGMDVELLEKTGEVVTFSAGGITHAFPPVVAANLSVRPLREGEGILAGMPLSEMDPGAESEVIGILPAIRGLERRRLLDLGVLPGTVIQAEFQSPQGDPTAYRIRDTLIALRDDQARSIIVQPREAA